MWVLNSVFIYIAFGVVFSVTFLARFVQEMDEGTAGTPWSFKLIILPGCVVFWPVLLIKFLKTRKSKRHD